MFRNQNDFNWSLLQNAYTLCFHSFSGVLLVSSDLKLVAADGTVMLQYVGTSSQSTGWIGGCVTCSYATVSSYAGMTLTSCVDKCSASLTIVYRDGDTFDLVGNAAYSNEWIYLDQLTQAVTLSAVGCTFIATRTRLLKVRTFSSPCLSRHRCLLLCDAFCRRVGHGHGGMAVGLPSRVQLLHRRHCQPHPKAVA
jgi:hypothetical protein